MALPFLIPAIVGAASLIGQWLGGRKQSKENMELAQFQAQANESYLDKQLAYNTPQAQMERFRAAGLNPHLIYGQGSPGNQNAPLSFPDIGRTDWQSIGANMAQTMNQTALTASQVQAIDAKTRDTYALTALRRLQANVLAANPLLNDAGFKATIDSLVSTAEIKAQESKQAGIQTFVDEAAQGHVVAKIQKEVELLSQRFELGNLDKTLKAEVLKSKQFQNAILDVQKKFLADGNMSAGQVLQFIQLLLLKML